MSKHIFPLILDGALQAVSASGSSTAWDGKTSYVEVDSSGGNETITIADGSLPGTLVTVIKKGATNVITVNPASDFATDQPSVALAEDNEMCTFFWDDSKWRVFNQAEGGLFNGGTVANSTTFSSDVTLGDANADKVEINGKLVQGNITQTDLDAQSGTISAANFLTGVVLHTSVSGAGVITFDTAANLISGLELEADNEVAKCLYINDGNQNVTLNGGSPTGVTYVNNPTVAAEGAATLVVRRTGSAAVSVYIV
jgi:hypothetical protein